MGTIVVIAPKLVRCIIPDRINQERRTKLARTVLTAARAYDRSGKPIGQPDRFAAAIIGRRLRATAQELAQIDKPKPKPSFFPHHKTGSPSVAEGLNK